MSKLPELLKQFPPEELLDAYDMAESARYIHRVHGSSQEKVDAARDRVEAIRNEILRRLKEHVT